jgi:hypothetical protein
MYLPRSVGSTSVGSTKLNQSIIQASGDFRFSLPSTPGSSGSDRPACIQVEATGAWSSLCPLRYSHAF